MKKILWRDFLRKEHLKTASPEMIKVIENEIGGYPLPAKLKDFLMHHGGQKPENLVPLYPSGKPMIIECIYHCYSRDEKYSSYTMRCIKSCLDEAGYRDLVPFTDKGNAYLCLDYRNNKETPSVCFVFGDDNPKEDPPHKIADNFDEFLEKFTVDPE